MFYRKHGLPQEGEIILCTVTSIKHHSVFVYLDVYRIDGLIHISEISAGRIRNIRNYVKEGKKVVCKVLRVKKKRKQVDLSLRRVNEREKREKISEIKQEQKAEKIIEYIASETDMKTKEFYKEVMEAISESYPNLHTFFQEIVDEEVSISDFKIKNAELLEEAVRKRVKPTEVTIKGTLKLTSYKPDGVEVIRKALKESKIDEGIEVRYLGGGNYRLIVTASDYKTAESLIEESSKKALACVSEEGAGEFKR